MAAGFGLTDLAAAEVTFTVLSRPSRSQMVCTVLAMVPVLPV